MSKKFRISSKRIFLTYPQFNSTKDDIKEQLFQVLTNYLPFDYCISQEIHKDGNLHFHVFLQSKSKFNIKNINVLKLKTTDGIFKSGDYKSVQGSSSSVLRYLVKQDKEPLTNMFFNCDTGKELSLEEKTIELYKIKGYDASLDYFKDNATNIDLFNKYNKIRATLNNLHKDDNRKYKLNYVPLNIKEFINQHSVGKQIDQWFMNSSDKTLYLSGPSGIGKTESLKTYLASKLESPDQLGFVRHLETLKSFDVNDKDILLFDDFPLEKIFKNKPEELIHFVDRRNPSPVRVLYGIIIIQIDLKVILISNIKLNSILKVLNFSIEQTEAINRRIINIETTNEPFPLVFPNKDNIEELKKNLDIYHPNWKELEINIKIKIK
jgi:hypothetical protein